MLYNLRYLELLITSLCQLVCSFTCLSPDGSGNLYMYKFLYLCIYIYGLDPPPTYSWKAWQSWGFALSWTRRREVTASEKRISVPGFACLEGVPSPLQAARDRESHGSLFSKLSNGPFGFLLLLGCLGS